MGADSFGAVMLARGKRLGLDVVLVTPQDAQRLMPYLATDGIRAAMHVRSDIYLEPVQVPAGYARASARLGVSRPSWRGRASRLRGRERPTLARRVGSSTP